MYGLDSFAFAHFPSSWGLQIFSQYFGNFTGGDVDRGQIKVCWFCLKHNRVDFFILFKKILDSVILVQQRGPVGSRRPGPWGLLELVKWYFKSIIKDNCDSIKYVRREVRESLKASSLHNRCIFLGDRGFKDPGALADSRVFSEKQSGV